MEEGGVMEEFWFKVPKEWAACEQVDHAIRLLRKQPNLLLELVSELIGDQEASAS